MVDLLPNERRARRMQRRLQLIVDPGNVAVERLHHSKNDLPM